MIFVFLEKPDSPVIDSVLAVNSSVVYLSWIPPLYNCSLTYPVEVAERNGSVVLVDTVNATDLTITTLIIGKVYSFRVASMDAAGRTSNWSEPVFLLIQGWECKDRHNCVYVVFKTATHTQMYSTNVNMLCVRVCNGIVQTTCGTKRHSDVSFTSPPLTPQCHNIKITVTIFINVYMCAQL